MKIFLVVLFLVVYAQPAKPQNLNDLLEKQRAQINTLLKVAKLQSQIQELSTDAIIQCGRSEDYSAKVKQVVQLEKEIIEIIEAKR